MAMPILQEDGDIAVLLQLKHSAHFSRKWRWLLALKDDTQPGPSGAIKSIFKGKSACVNVRGEKCLDQV